VLPAITDHELPRIVEEVAGAGAVSVGYVMLRLPGAVSPLFESWLDRHFPDRKAKVLNRIRSMRGGHLNDPRFGSRMRGEGPFADHVRAMFEIARRKAGLEGASLPLDVTAFRRPADPSLLSLFGDS